MTRPSAQLGLSRLFVTCNFLFLACCAWMPFEKEREAGARHEHAAAVLEGAEEFRLLLWDVDTAIVSFQYRLPPATDLTSVVNEVAHRISAHNKCFQVREAARYETRLSCPNRRGDGFEEYLIGVLPRDRTVAVLYAAISGPAETRAYPSTVEAFRRDVLDQPE
jgi:hypothetical protein